MAKDKVNEVPADGVTKREDHGFYDVITGSRGEVTVLAHDDVVLTPEQRQEVIDKSIELSATPVELDARHSEHPDHQATDGTYVNRKEDEVGYSDEQLEMQRASAATAPGANAVTPE